MLRQENNKNKKKFPKSVELEQNPNENLIFTYDK